MCQLRVSKCRGVSKYQEPIKYNKYVEMWVALLCKKKEMLSRNVVWCLEEPKPRGYAKTAHGCRVVGASINKFFQTQTKREKEKEKPEQGKKPKEKESRFQSTKNPSDSYSGRCVFR